MSQNIMISILNKLGIRVKDSDGEMRDMSELLATIDQSIDEMVGNKEDDMSMKRSESINELAMALAKFQGEVTNPNNAAVNPFFKSKYAPLDVVLNTVRPILGKYGLSVMQMPVMKLEAGMVGVITTLLHSSGEFIESEPLLFRMEKNTPQGAGSAITYARRYALSAMLGVASEDDDDGNMAEKAAQKDKTKNKSVKSSKATQKQLKEIATICKEKGLTDSLKPLVKQSMGKDDLTTMTGDEADKLIKALNKMEGKKE